MQNIRATSRLDKNELRPSRYGALDLFLKQTDDPMGIVTPELKDKAMASIGSTLETPVIDFDGAVSIGNSRSVTISDDENTSQMSSITFATYAWGFTLVPSLFHNNEIAMQRDFETKFLKYLYKFASTLDSAAVAALAAAKTQVFGETLQYSTSGNAVIAPWKDRENVIGDINVMMAANDHFNQIHIVGNGGIESMIRKMAEKGLYNSVNKQLEYSDKILHFTNRITNGAGEYGNLYAVNGGTTGILARFEREALLNTRMADGTAWGIDTLPLIDFPCGTYFYESKGDFSSIAGAASADMDRVRKEHYGFAVDVAFLTGYNSDSSTIAHPIMQVTVNDETVTDAIQVKITNTNSDPVRTQEVS